ncbi:ATP-dependent RecD-like DNA helicase [Bacillaceae bacterium S4-13-58]
MEQLKEAGYIKGEILKMLFHNQEDHFSIGLIRIIETNEEIEEKKIAVKGHFPYLDEKEIYHFEGSLTEHPKFGAQYDVVTFQRVIPTGKEGVIQYLSSHLFHGIGKKLAKRIVDQLGESAVQSILNDPDALDQVKGLTQEKKDRLVKDLQEHQGFEYVAVNLNKYGFGLQMSQRLYEVYGTDTVKIIEGNPYHPIFEVEGYGFQRADQLAKQLNLSMDHPSRVQAGCMYSLYELSQEGHVFSKVDPLLSKVHNLLFPSTYPVEKKLISQEINSLIKLHKLVLEDDRIYLHSLYHAEKGFANHIARLSKIKIEETVPTAEIMKMIGKIEEKEGFSYSNEQFEAIQGALSSSLFILTGGPGTGKTTVIKGILNAYASYHRLSLNPHDYKGKDPFPFVLTAPTGRAAKRITESTGVPAMTIHRLLGWKGGESFEKNQQEPLEGKLLIVDEFSMVDIWLANQLFRAIPKDMQVIIVGDQDQLPSVGPGQVLTDLLQEESIPVIELQEVYRQAEGSKIIELAHLMKKGSCSISHLDKDRDFSFINCQEYQAIGVIEKVVQKAIEKGVSIKDLQVLAPMYRSDVGINQINEALQNLINPQSSEKREWKGSQRVLRVGDKVLQLVNQPEKGVFNGDIGTVVTIQMADENEEQKECMIVDFDGKEVSYERKDANQLTLSYCCSIHKAQGSEFQIVLVPVFHSYRRMLRKKLLYTAVTRAKSSLILLGDKEAFLYGVKREEEYQRFSTLRERLQFSFASHVIEDEEDVSPYDFMGNDE